jgi:transposase
VENAGGLGRYLAGRLAVTGESVVDVPPKLSARVRVLSSFAGNARKNDGLDALATALWPPRATSSWQRSIPRLTQRCCACFPRGAKTWWPNVPERSRQLARASARPPARQDSRNALGQPGCTHSARHTAAGLFVGRPPPTSFGGAALRIRTLDRKIADLNERIEAEVEASGTTLTEILGIGPILAARIMGTG